MNPEQERKLRNWMPKPGIYQSVLPGGKLHIDTFPIDRNVEVVTLVKGQEVELRTKELRALKQSELLRLGYLAPIYHFEKDEEGNEIEVEVLEDDPINPNVVSDRAILLALQNVGSSDDFKKKVQTISSELTLVRYQKACHDLDTPSSYIKHINDRLKELEAQKAAEMRTGIVSDERRRLLTEKIHK